MFETSFITGASSGIGAQTDGAATIAGWNVGQFARIKDILERLTAEIGARAIALPGDNTDADAQRMAIETFINEFGQLDAVF